MPELWLTVTQAAVVTGYHPEHLRELIRDGKIEARKFGPLWQVNRNSLMTYLRAAEKSKDGRRGPKAE